MEKENTAARILPWACLALIFVPVSVCFYLRQFSVTAAAELCVLLLIPLMYLIPYPVAATAVCIAGGICLFAFARGAFLKFYAVPVCFLLQKLADDTALQRDRDTLCKAALTAAAAGNMAFAAASFEPIRVMLAEPSVVVCLIVTGAALLLNLLFFFRARKTAFVYKKKTRFWRTLAYILPVPAGAVQFVFAVSDAFLYGYPGSFYLPVLILWHWGLFWILSAARKESSQRYYSEKCAAAFAARFLD